MSKLCALYKYISCNELYNTYNFLRFLQKLYSFIINYKNNDLDILKTSSVKIPNNLD